MILATNLKEKKHWRVVGRGLLLSSKLCFFFSVDRLKVIFLCQYQISSKHTTFSILWTKFWYLKVKHKQCITLYVWDRNKIKRHLTFWSTQVFILIGRLLQSVKLYALKILHGLSKIVHFGLRLHFIVYIAGEAGG